MEIDGELSILGEQIRSVDQRIKKVLLFGSTARGENGPESDVDLCIVVPDSTKTGVAERIRQGVLSKLRTDGVITGEVPGGITVEVISEGELIAGEKRGQLYWNIQKEAIDL